VKNETIRVLSTVKMEAGAPSGGSSSNSTRSEEEELDRQLELIMSRRNEVVNSLHALPTSSSSPLGGPPNCCNLHLIPMKNKSKLQSQVFSKSTLDIVRGSKQHVYDDSGVQYLDCVNGTSHVGHCHPQVVAAGHRQMSRLVTSQGFTSDLLSRFVSALLDTMPEPLNVCYLTNSGSEANDLSLRLASSHTGREDIVVLEDGYHGNIGSLIDASPKMHQRMNHKKKDHIHIARLPDLYRGKYRYGDEQAGAKYAKDLEEVILQAESKGRRIGAFLFEPMLVIPGVYMPPPSYYQNVFRIIREHGGLVIADEVQSGLGRMGNNMWAFMDYGLVPDIVTIGKGLGNGFPMGAVICSREVSDRLGGYFSTFGGNPVACAIGMSVLEVIKNEKLISSANRVGKHLQKSLLNIKERFTCVGDVRGSGLVHAVEIVDNKEERIPSPDLASEIMFGMKTRQVLVAITGKQRNVILITPPMCFNMENCQVLVSALEDILTALNQNPSKIAIETIEPELEKPANKRIRLEDLESEERSDEESVEYDILCEMD